LACHIEARAGVELTDHSALGELRTVGQLVQLVRAQLRRAGALGGRA
jgi:acyl carrier protein